MLINNQAPYYDDYSPNKNYVQMLALPGRAVQAREFTQLNTMILDYLGRLGDSYFAEGTIISGCAIAINGHTATISSGRMYLGGLVRIIDESTVEITGSGAEVIGARVIQQIVTSNEDPTLLDPAQGFKNYNQEGCNRVKETVQFFVNDENSTTIYNLLDGELVTTETGENNSTIVDMMARRTYDESGNYKISGLELQDREEASDGHIYVSLTAGKAYIKGYEVIKNGNALVTLNFSQTTRSVISESKVYYDGTLTYPIINQPVKQINSVTTQVQVTENMTRGNITGGTDYLNYTPVVSIVSITSNGVTYEEGIDYQLTTDGVDWSLSGKEPSIGTTYTCIYIYNKVMVKDEDYVLELNEDDNNYYFKLTGTGDLPVNKSYIYLNYDFYLARRDLVCLGRNGAIEVIEGTPDITRLLESPINQDENRLTIGTVTIAPNSPNITIVNTYTTRLTELDLYNMLRRIQDIEFNTAVNDLDQEAINSEAATALNGVLTDGFVGLTKCDLGNEEFNCTIDLDNQELSLPSNQYIIPAVPNTGSVATTTTTLGRIISAPYTESVGIFQNKATERMLVNPYAVYTPMSLVKINPEVDNWIDTKYVTVNKVKTRTVTLRRWWYHRGESWAEAEHQKYLALGITGTEKWDWSHQGGTNDQGNTSWGKQTGSVTTTQQSVFNEVQTYMRQITINVAGTNFSADADNIVCDFNNTRVPLTPTGSTQIGSAGTGTVRANSAGQFTAKFTVPPNTPSGTVEVVLSNSTNKGVATFQSQGRTQTITTTVLTTKTTVNTTDPLAQSFSFDEDTVVTKFGLYFAEKSNSQSVYVQIRDLVNGYPGTTCYAEVIVDPADILTSTDASKETIVRLNQPLYCNANSQYCVCILSDSNVYSMYTATLGEKDITTGEFVTSQPYGAGVLFSSSNALTWTAHQKTDLKFKVYKASYTGKGVVMFNDLTTDDITRLVLAAQSVDYANAGIEWYYRLSDTSSWLPLSAYTDRDIGSKTDVIKLKAELNTSQSSSTSPLIAGDCINLVGFINESTGAYVTRTVTMDEKFSRIRLLANISAPTGTQVKFYYKTDVETDWVEITDTPTITAVDTEFSTYEFLHTCPEAKTYKLKIMMSTSNLLIRPRIKKLINILRF